MTIQTSSYRAEIPSKMDIDPGYFCKYFRDQIVLKWVSTYRVHSKIIDVGCDRGHIPYILSARGMEFQYIGLDIDISRFYDPKAKGVKLLQCNGSVDTIEKIQAQELDTSREQISILLLDVIEHMETYELGLQLLRSAIMKLSNSGGGTLVVSTPNRQSDDPSKVNWPKYHTYEYSLSELKDALASTEIADLIISTNTIGWSMSNEDFLLGDMQRAAPRLPYDLSFEMGVPFEMTRVLAAAMHPEYSRDVLMKIEIAGKH